MIKVGKRKMSLGLSMIVKNETSTLETALKSAAPLVDEIVVNWNGEPRNPETGRILEKYGAKIVSKPWNRHFGEARQFCYDQMTTDLVIWLDADDEILNPGAVKDLIAKTFVNERNGAIWVNWKYAFNEKGECTKELWRERIVVRRWWEWRDRIHETLMTRRACEQAFTDMIEIKHNATEAQVAEGSARNLALALEQYEIESRDGKFDAKTILDAARSLVAVEKYNEAIKLFNQYIEFSGWDNERAYVYCILAEIYRKFHRFETALVHDALAENIKPEWPDAYYGKAATYFCQEKWEEAIAMCAIGRMMKPPYGIMPVDPTTYNLRPFITMAQSYVQLGKFDEALAASQKGLTYYPTNELLIRLRNISIECLKNEDVIQAGILLKNSIEKDKVKSKSKLKHLLKAMPFYGPEHPTFRRLKNLLYSKSKDNRMVIFCGSQNDQWGPSSVNKGVGGSEEAVINMANEFTKLGWNVEVYNECNEPGISKEGVLYGNFDEYLATKPASVYIGWRMGNYIDFSPKQCGAKVIWCHDVQRPEYWSEKGIEATDKIIVLSKHHRTNLPDIPDNKFMISSNGINPDHFRTPENEFPKKVEGKCIYASSPDRGLDIVLDAWPRIRLANPKATLHVYYGFTPNYDIVNANDLGRRKFKEMILEGLKQPGIFYYGMVGHKKLAESFLTSQFWLYPCYFEEISCITAMKAQAAGAMPITSTVGALKETVQFGYRHEGDLCRKEEQDKWANKAIEMIGNGPSVVDATKMRKWALETYSWAKVAKDWDTYFRAKIEERKHDNLKAGK